VNYLSVNSLKASDCALRVAGPMSPLVGAVRRGKIAVPGISRAAIVRLVAASLRCCPRSADDEQGMRTLFRNAQRRAGGI